VPKHVVSLNKDNKIRQLCFESKEPYLIVNKHNGDDAPEEELDVTCFQREAAIL